MIRSMTGYGNAQAENDNLLISVEVKTLNSKFLELNIKSPRDYNEKEMELRNTASALLERGKVNINIERTTKGGVRPKVQVNMPLFLAYYEQLRKAADAVKEDYRDIFRMAMLMPDATISDLQTDRTEAQEQEWALLHTAFNEALDKCNQFRIQEGATLAQKLSEYATNIENLLIEVEAGDAQRIAGTRQRIYDRLKEMNDIPLDNNRFEQEMIYYIEKLDINEEKVRLRSHLTYFQEALHNGNGKKLGFISQEIGREINTIGSKVNDAIIQRVVVQMKEELEKIKEQSLNII
jgi:uncharacterized protein (TIGR00255 family)